MAKEPGARIHLLIPGALLAALKRVIAHTGGTLSEHVREAIRRYITTEQRRQPPDPNA